MRKLLGTFFVLVFAQSAMAGGPKVTETLKHYKISGTTINALKASMKKKGPHGFWGYTRWDMKWTGSCKITLKIKYTMPELGSPKKVPADVKAKFDKMYVELMKHEKNHGKIAIAGAKKIAAKKCKKGNDVLDEINRNNSAYDKRTKHGFREGVRF